MSVGESGGTAGIRWESATPDARLTWGRAVTGDAFVERLLRWWSPSPHAQLLEIGPGYGRLLRSLHARRVPFGQYVGVDRSRANCEALTQVFRDDPRVSFVCADAATVRLERPFDVLISSLTLKHLHPTFAPALANLVPQARAEAEFVFDLLEAQLGGLATDLARGALGRVRFEAATGPSIERLRTALRVGYGFFERDGGAYVRRYARAGLPALLAGCGLELRAFDHVQHDRGHRRLLVVARPRGGPPAAGTTG